MDDHIQMASVMKSGTYPVPRYFISRSDGNLVPLIAADELPDHINLQGVQRTLSFEQTRGMQYIGALPQVDATYSVVSYASPTQASNTQSPSTAPLSPPHKSSKSWRVMEPISPSDAITINKIQSKIDAIVSSKTPTQTPTPTSTPTKAKDAFGRPLPPSGQVLNEKNKEYCTYWIRTGSCDYVQQGCMYKHEMPDVATLEKIGFRSTPKWWLDGKRGFKGGSGVKGRLNAARRGDQSKSSDETKGKIVKVNENDGSSDSDVGGKKWPVQHATAAIHPIKDQSKTPSKSTPVDNLIDLGIETPTSSPNSFVCVTLTPSTTSSPASSPATKSEEVAEKSDNTSSSSGDSPKKLADKQSARVFNPRGESVERHIFTAMKKYRRDLRRERKETHRQNHRQSGSETPEVKNEE